MVIRMKKKRNQIQRNKMDKEHCRKPKYFIIKVEVILIRLRIAHTRFIQSHNVQRRPILSFFLWSPIVSQIHSQTIIDIGLRKISQSLSIQSQLKKIQATPTNNSYNLLQKPILEIESYKYGLSINVILVLLLLSS